MHHSFSLLQIKQLKKMPGVWPPEFEDQQKGHPMANQVRSLEGLKLKMKHIYSIYI
jgi:hypothetical protein